MVKLIFTLFLDLFEVIIVYFFWYAFDIIFYSFLRCIRTIFKDFSVFDNLRRLYLIQKLSFFFEKSFFFLFSENKFPRINFFKFLKKNKPNVSRFHFFKNQIDLKKFFFLDLNFFTKQFNFFSNSFIFKNKFLSLKNLFNFNFFNIKINMFFYFFILNKFFFKKFYRFLSFVFFYNFENLNFIKLNFIFFIFFKNSNGLLKQLDLGKFYDWCLFHKALFKINNYKIKKNKIILKKSLVIKNKYFKNKKIQYLKKTYNIYKKNYSEFASWIVTDLLWVGKKDEKKILYSYKNIFLLRFKTFFNKKFNNSIKNGPTNIIKFSDSSMNKYIGYKNLKKFNFFFLRKNRIFNKSRYSRNRQLYRTGFYWCLWLNIIIVYGLFFLFYRFTFNFGYVWWGIMFLFYSFIFSKVCKYNFYNIFTLINEIKLLLEWFGLLIKEFIDNLNTFLKPFFVRWYALTNLSQEMDYHDMDSGNTYLIWYNKNVIDINNGLYSNIIIKYIDLLELCKKVPNTFLWNGYPQIDTSFLMHKSIIHGFKELGRMYSTK